MKLFRFFTMAVAVLSLALGACTKDDGDEDSDSGSYYFKVSIDGAKFHLGTSMSDVDEGGGNIGGTLLDDATNAQSIQLNLYAEDLKNKKAGAYTPTSQYGVVLLDNNGSTWYYSSGAFQVNELNLDKWTVKGTFSSITVKNGTQTKELKDGSFYVYLIHV